MDLIALVAVGLIALYLAVGCAVALAFVARGVTVVQAAPVTVGARILLWPASVLLWPLVLARWCRMGRSP